MPQTAFFDLDDTLLVGDSDVAWGRYLVTEGLVSPEPYTSQQQQFDVAYRQGILDMETYLTFVCSHLAEIPSDIRDSALHDFTQVVVRDMIKPAGQQQLKVHREQGDTIVLITATLLELAAPIAKLMGIQSVIASQCAWEGNTLTGRPRGLPCYQAGKVARATQYFSDCGVVAEDGFATSIFYSDSVNDVPLLEHVAMPKVVDPDPALASIAAERGWPVIRWT